MSHRQFHFRFRRSQRAHSNPGLVRLRHLSNYPIRTTNSLDRFDLSGFTLIELLVTITMLSVILALVGSIFSMLMRSEKLATQSLVTEQTIARLAIQFRGDVHQSTSGTFATNLPAAVQELILETDHGVGMRYQVTKSGLARQLFNHEEVVSREDFRLPDCQVQIVAGMESESSLRKLIIERPISTITRIPRATKPLRALEIKAYLNQQNLSRPKRTDAFRTEATKDANVREEVK